MKVKEITVSVSATIPTGNYANINPSVTWHCELGDEDDVSVMTEYCLRQIKERLSHIAASIAKKQLDAGMNINDIPAIEWLSRVVES